jgi:hypothetical protein
MVKFVFAALFCRAFMRFGSKPAPVAMVSSRKPTKVVGKIRVSIAIRILNLIFLAKKEKLMLPMASDEEFFEEVTHQGKTIKVGDQVIIQAAGESHTVEVTRLVKRQGHYWVGYDSDQFYPWPLVKLK